MAKFTRRNVLSGAAAGAIIGPAVIASRGAADQAPLPTLPDLPVADALLLRPGDSQFAQYQASFNLRTAQTPQLRALCKTAKSVGAMVEWCRINNLPFAVRCGGHSYEGFSQSSTVVIDMRLMDAISVDTKTNTATVGAGASLGDIYLAITRHGLAFPGGSCPTVGVSGHALGGGYGYLARSCGLACDNVLSIDLIDPQGNQITAAAEQNTDLFWACRGGGGGSFGVATGYRLKLYEVAKVLVFKIEWPSLSARRAAAVMKEWQAWAPQAPRSLELEFGDRPHDQWHHQYALCRHLDWVAQRTASVAERAVGEPSD